MLESFVGLLVVEARNDCRPTYELHCIARPMRINFFSCHALDGMLKAFLPANSFNVFTHEAQRIVAENDADLILLQWQALVQ